MRRLSGSARPRWAHSACWVSTGRSYTASCFRPDVLIAAPNDRPTAAFTAKTLLLVGVFAYLLERRGVARLGLRLVRVLAAAGQHGFCRPRGAAVPTASAGRKGEWGVLCHAAPVLRHRESGR